MLRFDSDLLSKDDFLGATSLQLERLDGEVSEIL